jgi:Uma2 family endonuclease
MATTRLPIGPADAGRMMTLDEFQEADAAEGFKYELARGILEVNAIPKTPHRRVVSNLFQLAALYGQAHPGVIDYFGGGTEVRAWIPGADLARHPDFGVVFLGAGLDGVGDLKAGLFAEVVSASSKTRDYEHKRRDYLDYGVAEYWIVDPKQRQVVVLVRREAEGTAAAWSERVFQDDQVIESPALPGLNVVVSALWAGL